MTTKNTHKSRIFLNNLKIHINEGNFFYDDNELESNNMPVVDIT